MQNNSTTDGANIVPRTGTVTDSMKWKIEDGNEGCKIVSLLNPAYALATKTSDYTGLYNDTLAYSYGTPTVRSYDNMAFENWILIPTDITGIVFRNDAQGKLCNTFSATADIEFGSVEIADLGYTVLAFSENGTPEIALSCRKNPGIANINPLGNKITLYKTGISELSVSMGDTDTTQSLSFTLYVVSCGVGIQNSTSYYIMNADTDRYLSLESTSDVNATNVITEPRSADTIAQWVVDKQIDGQYQLINKHSTTDKVLNVSGANVNIYSDTNDSDQIFTIERIDDGSGLYHITCGSFYVAQDIDYNVCLTAVTSDAVRWSFIDATPGKFELYNFDYYDTKEGQQCNTTAYQDDLCMAFQSIGYSYQHSTNTLMTTAYEGLKTADIFMFFGHANKGVIAFYDDNGVENGRILVGNSTDTDTATKCYISNLPANSLASLRCVFYLGCQTGNDNLDGLNLVDATYEKGAHFVLGLTESVCLDSLDDWVEGFEKQVDDPTIPLSTIVERADAFAKSTKIKIGTDSSGNIIYGWIDQFPERNIGDVNQYLK